MLAPETTVLLHSTVVWKKKIQNKWAVAMIAVPVTDTTLTTEPAVPETPSTTNPHQSLLHDNNRSCETVSTHSADNI